MHPLDVSCYKNDTTFTTALSKQASMDSKSTAYVHLVGLCKMGTK